MAYVKPPWFVRTIANPIINALGVGGSETLSIVRRESGETQNIPVIPVEYEGSRYIVSTRGESDWVRNLRAAGGKGQLAKRGAVEMFQAVEVPVEQRASIIEAYRKKAGRTVDAYWKTLPEPADHPTFRLEMIGAS
jgi:hypothetical protein